MTATAEEEVFSDEVTYTENYVKARVRRSVLRTAVIALLLVFFVAMGLAIHARDRTPEGPVFNAVNEEFKGTGAHTGDDGRDLGSCYEYTQVVADRDLYRAAETCVRTIFGVGCSSGDYMFTDYYQIVYGGNWYVFCRCDC